MIDNMNPRSNVYVFSDGGWWRSCGCGAWAYVIHWRDKTGKQRELTHAQTANITTNQRMEMIGAIMALREIPPKAEIILISDSKYLVRGVTEWMPMWKQRGWVTVQGDPVKNRELWVELDRLNQLHNITWRWTKGHSNSKGNQKADLLVRTIMAETYGEHLRLPEKDI